MQPLGLDGAQDLLSSWGEKNKQLSLATFLLHYWTYLFPSIEGANSQAT